MRRLPSLILSFPPPFQLFLDDTKIKNFTSCFKEKKFLHFFFSRLRINDSGRFEEDFPYLSPCGRERNFIRCDDRPVVFTHLVPGEEEDLLLFGYAGELLKSRFDPASLCMYPGSGRVYHSAPESSGGVGLVRSALAMELSERFLWSEGLRPEADHPDSFEWRGQQHQLDNRLVKLLDSEDARFRRSSAT